MSNAMSTEAVIKSIALKYFDGVGFAAADRPPSFDRYANWISEGMHGQMDYLRRHIESKGDPQKLLPGARSWIALSLSYDTQEPLSTELADQMRRDNTGWIARYAREGDYHKIITALHEKMTAELTEVLPGEKFLSCVDIKAVLERDVAHRAGLGWIGKNTCLIDQKKGSFLFLSELLTTAELASDKAVLDHCGTCTRCLEACPTQALVEPRKLDATKCISYWTIEAKQPAPPELAARFGFNFFGCDICQDVCPWNKKARRQNELPAAASSGMISLQELIALPDAKLKDKTQFSAMSRAKPEQLKRNAKNVLENHARGSSGSRSSLTKLT